jgi:PhnB protein
MKVRAYLNFNGRTEEALAFYGKAIGAETTLLMRMSDSPEPHPPGMVPPGTEHKVMHSSFRVGETEVMATDGGCQGEASFSGISLTLTADDDTHAKKLFDALADGGKVQMPLAKTFFASSFGILSDRFGVNWMVITPTP